MVPDAHLLGILCPDDAMFQISGLWDLWVTDGSWCMFCIYILSWCWCDANFGSLERTWTEPKPKRDFPHTTIFDLSTIVSWANRGWKNPWVMMYHDSSKFQKLIRCFVKLLTWNWMTAVQHCLGMDPIWNLVGKVKINKFVCKPSLYKVVFTSILFLM